MRETYLIEGRGFAQAWAKACELIYRAGMEIATSELNFSTATKDLRLCFIFDEKAVSEIRKGDVHKLYKFKKKALEAYANELTYSFVRNQNKKEPRDQFEYNYFDLFVNSPLPDSNFIYQGTLKKFEGGDYATPEKGFDQISWIHDALRRDGLSRRNKISTWQPAMHYSTKNPPCLQSIWVRALSKKSEVPAHEKIPVEVQIDYRSWDIPGAFPSNIYALVKMLYRYVLGNLDEFSEKNNEGGWNDANNQEDYYIKSLVCIGASCHAYSWDFDICKKICSR